MKVKLDICYRFKAHIAMLQNFVHPLVLSHFLDNSTKLFESLK